MRLLHQKIVHLKKYINTFFGKFKKLSHQIKTLKQTVRRRDHKIKNMSELFKTLQKVNLIDKDSLMTLKHRFEGNDFEIFANQLRNKDWKAYGYRYFDELKQFAFSLHYSSPKAYLFCRLAWMSFLLLLALLYFFSFCLLYCIA